MQLWGKVTGLKRLNKGNIFAHGNYLYTKDSSYV